MKTQFEVERGELLSNFVLLEDHVIGNAPRCPFCMEKHIAGIKGYSEEIAKGKEGDEQTLLKLAEESEKMMQIANMLKKKNVPEAFEQVGVWARAWRRKLQGAEGHNHSEINHKVIPCSGPTCKGAQR